MALALDDAFEFVGDHSHAVLVTMKKDGRPQLSNIFYVPGRIPSTVRISVTEGRAKTKNLRRDPRSSLHVTREDCFAYVVLEGDVALSPVAAQVDDPVVDELVDMYRLGQGDHPDWDEFRRVMVQDQRVVATFSATRAYGMLNA
jgi:PPOX class probable F420-dependent enzyme